MTTHRLQQGARVRGGLTGQWYRVSVSTNIDYAHQYCAGDLVALTSGILKRESDGTNVQCTRSNPMLVSHVEVQ